MKFHEIRNIVVAHILEMYNTSSSDAYKIHCFKIKSSPKRCHKFKESPRNNNFGLIGQFM